MKTLQMPWVKQEDMVWINGRILIALDTSSYFSLPIIVRDFGNGFVESTTAPYQRYSVTDFTHYATITNPIV